MGATNTADNLYLVMYSLTPLNLNIESKSFNKNLQSLLLKRNKKIHLNSSSVIKIINDIKKNGDKALLKYEKKFSNHCCFGTKTSRLPLLLISDTKPAISMASIILAALL